MDSLVHDENLIIPATELGFVWSPGDHLATFVTAESFLADALSRPNVKAVIVDASVDISNVDNPLGTRIVPVRNAKYNFFRLHNAQREFVQMEPSRIDPSATIHPTALIDPVGVTIGANTVVEAYVTVEPGTCIGDNCIIRAGSRLGTNAMDIREDPDGNPYMTDHLGRVVIHDHVEIGYASVVDRAIWRHTDTVVGAHTKTSCHVNISHGVHVGKRNKLAAGVKICGSTFVGDDNWFGPGSIVSNLITVGSRNYVALGATVLTSIEDEAKVVGNRIFRDRKLF